MLNFKPIFSLSSFTFIKRLLVLLPFLPLRVMSSAYLRLLIFLLAVLIPACASSIPMFLMMYSAYKLNKQGDNIQPWGTPLPIWNQSAVPCPVLTVPSWPAYRFLRRHVRWSGIPISMNFPQYVVIHTVKGRSRCCFTVFFFLHFFFLGMVLITACCTVSWTSVHSLHALCLSDLIPWIYLSLPLYNHKGFDLVHTWMVWWFSLLSSI